MTQYTPSDKHPDIDNLLTKITGRSRPDSIRASKCATCGKDVTGFRDDLSRREYSISGMCQDCQDSVFGDDDD